MSVVGNRDSLIAGYERREILQVVADVVSRSDNQSLAGSTVSEPTHVPLPGGRHFLSVVFFSADRQSVLLADARGIVVARLLVDHGNLVREVVGASAKPVVVSIDDEPEILHQAEEILGRSFLLHTFTAPPPPDLLSILWPDLVVLDLLLPDQSGGGYLRGIRVHHGWTVPVIIVSGYPERKRHLDEEGLQYSLYLQKPANLLNIERAILGCLKLLPSPE